MTGCTCAECVRACAETNPGWFAPGEAERAAELIGMPFAEFAEKYLTKMDGFWTPRVEPAPRCVFLTAEDLCQIHAAKPLECREYFGCRPPKISIRNTMRLNATGKHATESSSG